MMLLSNYYATNKYNHCHLLVLCIPYFLQVQRRHSACLPFSILLAVKTKVSPNMSKTLYLPLYQTPTFHKVKIYSHTQYQNSTRPESGQVKNARYWDC